MSVVCVANISAIYFAVTFKSLPFKVLNNSLI